MMDVLLVVDMQEAALRGEPLHAISEVSTRINDLASWARASGGAVVFIQHTEAAGSPFEAGTRSWEVTDALDPRSVDLRVQKSLNDAFAETELTKEKLAGADTELAEAKYAETALADTELAKEKLADTELTKEKLAGAAPERAADKAADATVNEATD